MHSVRIDRINRLVEQRVSGTFDAATVERSGAEMRRAIRSLDAGPGGHLSLYDLSELTIPSDAVVEGAFQQLADPRFTYVRARKVAVVAPSALMRLKLAGPAAARDNMAVFAERPDAMRWLFAS